MARTAMTMSGGGRTAEHLSVGGFWPGVTAICGWSPLTEALWTCPTPRRTWLASDVKTRAGDRRLFRSCALPAFANAGRTRSSPCEWGHARPMKSLWPRACQPFPPETLPLWLATICREILDVRVPERKGRYGPRGVKRNMSGYPIRRARGPTKGRSPKEKHRKILM
jgi:hypothetical protein